MTFAFKWQTRKGLVQVCDKEVHVSMRYIVFSDRTFVMVIKEARAGVPCLPPTPGVWPVPMSGHWGKVSPGHRTWRPGEPPAWLATLSEQHTSAPASPGRVSSRKQLRTRHRGDTIITSGQLWCGVISEIVALKYCQIHTIRCIPQSIIMIS